MNYVYRTRRGVIKIITKVTEMLGFIGKDELRKEVILELEQKGGIENEEALLHLGSLLINLLLYKGQNRTIQEAIMKHEKVRDKIYFYYSDWKRSGYYSQLNICRSEMYAYIEEEIFLSLLDFISNISNDKCFTDNIEASFMAYINKRVLHRVLNVVTKFYGSKIGFLSGDDEEKLFSDSCVVENIVERNEIIRELKKSLDSLTVQEKELVYLTTIEKTNYETLSIKYNLKPATLRKKKERALKKIKNLIPIESILNERDG